MNEHDLLESMNGIEEELLERSEENRIKHKAGQKVKDGHREQLQRQHPLIKVPNNLWWRNLVAVALAVVVIGGAISISPQYKGVGSDGAVMDVPMESEEELEDSNGMGKDYDTFHQEENNAGLMNVHAIATPEYPEMAPYPKDDQFMNSSTGEFDNEGYLEAYGAWKESIKNQEQKDGYADRLDGYFLDTMSAFLSVSRGENVAYSPVNVFMALGMMAELTDGNSREQMLEVLGVENIEELRTLARAVWNGHYQDDGATTCVLASSLWLNQDIAYIKDTMSNLANYYYASSYQGLMGSEEYDQIFQNWLNEQTGGLLKDQIQELGFQSETIMALATTIYYQAKWKDEFHESANQNLPFHSPKGDFLCEFMYKSRLTDYYWGKNFSAIGLHLENKGGTMWFLLPKEGVTPEQLAKDEEAMRFLLSNGSWRLKKEATVHMYVPKFDITSQLELTEQLETLGITDVFDEKKSDFSPMTKDIEEIFVSRIQHDVRVKMDEKGVTAAAYTVAIKDAAAALPDEEIDFLLDRPFLFGIVSEDDMPLFVGLVNQPK